MPAFIGRTVILTLDVNWRKSAVNHSTKAFIDMVNIKIFFQGSMHGYGLSGKSMTQGKDYPCVKHHCETV